MEENKNFNSVDAFKLLMAVAVVAIHTNPIVSWTNGIAIKTVVIVEEWAVPFFFTASGFLLFNSMKAPYEEHIERIGRYIFKITKMYCAWTLISFPLTLYGYFNSGNSIISCILSYFKYFLFVGKLYNSYHLWYLLALIYALLAIRTMIKNGFAPANIAITSVFIYVFSRIMLFLMENANTLAGAVRTFVSLYRYVFNNGGIFAGIAYVSVGMITAFFGLRINKWIGFLAVAALNVLKLLISNNFVTGLLMPAEAAMLFMAVLDIKLPDHAAWAVCRKASTIIYLSHLIFFSIYTFIVLGNPNKLGFDSFAVTLFLSALNAALLIRVQKRGHMKVLRDII